MLFWKLAWSSKAHLEKYPTYLGILIKLVTSHQITGSTCIQGLGIKQVSNTTGKDHAATLEFCHHSIL